MRRVPYQLAVLFAASALVPFTALAQGNSGDTPQHTRNQDAQSQSGAQSTQDIRASKLIGAPIQAGQGEQVGQITDFLVNPRTGSVDFALLYDGQNMMPVPWQAINIQSEKTYALSINKQKLQSGPKLSQQQLEALQPDYVVQVYRFYGFEPPASGSTGAGTAPGGTGSGSSQDGSQSDQQAPYQPQPQQQQ